MKYLSNETKISKYYVEDPNLKVRFKIINGVRHWLTPPPPNYER
tara:strand:+ start:352 stop:483 length:132 start_codon:yes stop_codon:yes gene_type:complete